MKACVYSAVLAEGGTTSHVETDDEHMRKAGVAHFLRAFVEQRGKPSLKLILNFEGAPYNMTLEWEEDGKLVVWHP